MLTYFYAIAEVDLFSFDAPAEPAPAPVAADAGFDAFQSAPASAADTGFDAFQSAPAPAPLVPPVAQDPFGDFIGPAVHAQPQNVQFDAFGNNNVMAAGSNNNMAAMNNAFGNMNIQQQQTMTNGGGMMGGMQQPMASANVMSGGSGMQPVTAPANDDDFGDFEDASPSKATTTSSDPLSKLISLDSLTKNPKKEDKINEPIVATPAAANFVNQQQQIQQVHQSTNAAASFQGIDGLNKSSNLESKKPVSTRKAGQPVMGASDGSGKTELIGMMSPEMMGQQQVPQQQNNLAMQQQLMMQQQMMLQQQRMMQQQQQMGMMNNQNMMMNPQMMTNPNMMNNPQMNYMQGGMSMHGGMNTQGNMNYMEGMGQPQGGNTMGGSMGGQTNGTGGWP